MIPSNRARTRWQWQPTLTFHSPNPPITIKSPSAAGRTTKNTDPSNLGNFSGISRTVINPALMLLFGFWFESMR